MRYVEGLISLAAVAAAMAALPAEAAQEREPWAKVGEWEVSPLRAGYCTAARAYPGGTRVSISSLQGGSASLSVTNRDWLQRIEFHYRLRLVQEGSPRIFAGGAKPEFRNLNLVSRPGAELLAQLAGGGILEIVGPAGALIERLDLSGVAPALARLAPCLAHATLENFPPVAPPPPPPPPQSGQVGPVGPQAPLASLFSSADYPPSALRAREQGTVGFRVDVGEDGRIAACTVTASSGSAALDSTTCRLIIMRARFRPARDNRGRPTTDSYNGRITWRLPEPEPPLSSP